MDNIVCISHSHDIDGLVCAAFLRMSRNAEFILLDYPNLLEKLKSIKDNVDILYICDLQLDTSVIDEIKRISKYTKIIYIDHHPLKEGILENLQNLNVEIIHSTKKCAGMITYQLFRDKLPENASILAAYAILSDYPYTNPEVTNFLKQFDPHFLAFEYSILYYAVARAFENDQFKSKIVNELSLLKLPHEIEKVIDLAKEQIESSINLMKNSDDKISCCKNLACIEVPGDTGVMANMLMNIVKKPALICYRKCSDAHAQKYYHVSIRNKNLHNNLGYLTAKVAKKVKGSGGGHPKAAAAQLPQKSFVKFIECLDSEL